MKTKDVWFNRGRWLVRCPVCGSKTALKPEGPQKEIKFYCGACYGGKIAKVPVLLPGGSFVWGFDHKGQREAAQAARDNGEIHVAVLRLIGRRLRNYLGFGELHTWDSILGISRLPIIKRTIKDLERENASDPVLSYLWANPPVKDLKPIPVEEFEPEAKPTKKKLTDAEFRRLQ